MKKNLAVLFLVSILSLAAFAAIPQQMNYQGRLKNSSGTPLTGSYSILFTIYDAASGGTDLWNETQSVTAETGLFNVLLGSVTPIGTSVFTGADRWLGVKVGSDAEMTPRQKLVSVANAYKASNADNLGGLPASSYATAGATSQWTTNGAKIYYNAGNVGIGTPEPTTKLHVRPIAGANFGISNTVSGTNVVVTAFNDGGSANVPIYHQADGFHFLNNYGVAEIVTFANGGNVGIGTTSPTSGVRLHVYDDVNSPTRIRVQNPNTGTGALAVLDLVTSGGTGYIYRTGSGYTTYPSIQNDLVIRDDGGGDIVFMQTGTQEIMRLKSAGFVGIGTAEPGSNTLELNTTTKASVNAAMALKAAATKPALIGFYSNNTATANASIGQAGGTNQFFSNIAAGDLALRAPNNQKVLLGADNGAGNNAATMAITGSNVGIGTTDATSRLSVAGTIEIKAGSGGGLKFADGTVQTTAGGGGSSQWTTSGSDIYYNSGDVGIGTASPGALGGGGTRTNLQVHNAGTDTLSFGSISMSTAAMGNNSYAGSLQFGLTGLSGTEKRTAYIASKKTDAATDNPTGNLIFATANAGTLNQQMMITSGGNVGINTTNPGYTLEVAGIVNASQYLTNGADYAEYFENEELVPAGSLVGINVASGKVRVYRAGDEYIGIATTAASAGYVGNSSKAKEGDPGQTLVGLLGQLDLNSATARVIGRIVYTPDMKKAGILLSNNKVFVGK